MLNLTLRSPSVGPIVGHTTSLYVSKLLAEAMHGEMGAESVKGEGSTF